MDRLLFVDDDTDILNLNQAYFSEHGFLVDKASSAEDALVLLDKSDYDCIILDIQIDGDNGIELCRKLRDSDNIGDTPIIFLTVLSDEATLEKSFLSGGDDYISKPYRMKELELRIRARIHPRSHSLSDAREGSQLYIFPDEKQAYIGSVSLELTISEFQILQFLNEHKGVPFSQEAIYEAVWGERYNTHSIQVLIMRIRRKIKALSPDKEYIRTQWGKGYVFTE